MRMIFRRRTLLVAVVCAVTSVLATVTPIAASGSAAATSRASVTIGYPTPVPDLLAPALANAAGIFGKNGVKANVTITSSVALRSAVVSGQVPFAVLGGPEGELLHLEGAQVKVLADFAKTANAFLVVPSSITSISQLAGKPVGDSGPDTQSQVYMALALKTAGLSLSDVTQVPVLNQSEIVPDLSSGAIDAWTPEPPITGEMLSALPGSHILLNFRKAKIKFPEAELIANMNYVKSHKQITLDVLKSLVQAIPLYDKRPAFTKGVMTSQANAAGQPASPANIASSYTFFRNVLTQQLVPTKGLERSVFATLRSVGQTAPADEAPNVIDAQYAKEALKALGIKEKDS